jgi:hypothetical protein
VNQSRIQPRRPEEEPNYLAPNTIRFVDPDTLVVTDIGPGMWIRKVSRTRSGNPVGFEGQVLRVDTASRSVRFHQGNDPHTGEDRNLRLENRTKWEQVVSFEGDKVFYELIDEPKQAPPETPEQKKARLYAELEALASASSSAAGTVTVESIDRVGLGTTTVTLGPEHGEPTLQPKGKKK